MSDTAVEVEGFVVGLTGQQDVSDDLHRWLTDFGDSRCHLLFDPGLRTLAEDSLLNEALDNGSVDATTAVRHPIPLPKSGIEPKKSPWLAWLSTDRSAGSAALSQSLQDARAELSPSDLARGLGRRIGGWLVSKGSSKELAAHLAHVMLHGVSGSHSRIWLRIHDPAVLWPLFSLLSPHQRAVLMGRILHWWIFDPAGNLVRLDRPAQLADPLQDVLILNQEQWHAVLQFTALNQAIKNWLSIQTYPPSPHDMAQSAAVAMAALNRARERGLPDDIADLSLFAFHAMTIHPRFDMHPRIESVLARSRSTDNPDFYHYTSVCEELSEEDWLHVRNEI